MANERNRQQNPERKEIDVELKEIQDSRHKEIERKHDREQRNEKKSPELEGARHEIEKATASEKQRKSEKTVDESRNNKTIRNKLTQKAAFNKQMKDIQHEMPAANRAFSKLIHNKAVENSSEAIGSTVARPNAILAGSFFALLLTTGLYFWAENYGYPLSGFETIAAFIVGWILGITFDFTRIMVTGKK